MIDEDEIQRLSAEGHARLLIVEGVPIWEPIGYPYHQIAIQEIRKTIRPQEGSTRTYEDIYDVDICLPNDNWLRPDIAIFDAPVPLQDTALTFPPAAVIEVVLERFEKKDLEILPPAYLRAGVLDVVVYNSDTKAILWFDQETGARHPRRLEAPQTLTLRCGCQVTIG